MLSKLVYCALVSTTTFGVLSASASTLTLQQGLDGYTGTRDDTGLKDRTYTNYNRDDNLFAYETRVGPNLGTVVGFDVSSLPTGATITSATLQMTIGQGNFGPAGGTGTHITFEVKDPSAQWVEGDVDEIFANDTGRGVFWNASDADNNVFTTSGYNSAVGITMANQPVIDSHSISADGNVTGAVVSFDVTSLVTGWADGSQENRGFALVNTDSDSVAQNLFWAGKANLNQAYRPELVIEYAVPEPASLGLLGIGATLMLRRRSK